MFVVAPFAPDPLAYGGGAFVPFVLMSIIGQPTMPKAIVFFLLWQWGQVFARAHSIGAGRRVDGVPSIDGADLLYAYWYAMRVADHVGGCVSASCSETSGRPHSPNITPTSGGGRRTW